MYSPIILVNKNLGRLNSLFIKNVLTSLYSRITPYKPGNLRETRHKGRNSAGKSGQCSCVGQYKKCVQ